MKLTYTMVFILVTLLFSQSATSNPAETGGLCDVKAEGGEVVSYRSCEELILTTKMPSRRRHKFNHIKRRHE